MLKIYTHKPDHLTISVEVASCYIEIDNKTLFLQRTHNSKYEPKAWGVPAGKIEPNESPLDAAIRELHEETAIVIEKSMIQPIGTLYIEKPGGAYAYHMFKVTLQEQP
jgi:8-oxo-dGTP pyrophosphatase MutT (NUDIX family)